MALPKTVSPARAAENFDVWDFALDDDDMTRLGGLDRPDGKMLPAPESMNTLF